MLSILNKKIANLILFAMSASMFSQAQYKEDRDEYEYEDDDKNSIGFGGSLGAGFQEDASALRIALNSYLLGVLTDSVHYIISLNAGACSCAKPGSTWSMFIDVDTGLGAQILNIYIFLTAGIANKMSWPSYNPELIIQPTVAMLFVYPLSVSVNSMLRVGYTLPVILHKQSLKRHNKQTSVAGVKPADLNNMCQEVQVSVASALDTYAKQIESMEDVEKMDALIDKELQSIESRITNAATNLNTVSETVYQESLQAAQTERLRSTATELILKMFQEQVIAIKSDSSLTDSRKKHAIQASRNQILFDLNELVRDVASNDSSQLIGNAANKYNIKKNNNVAKSEVVVSLGLSIAVQNNNDDSSLEDAE
jgi:hypothetical protein